MNGRQLAAATLVGVMVLLFAFSSGVFGEQDPGKGYDPAEAYPSAVDQVQRPSDFFAAFIAAYEADRRWFKEEKGIDLTPTEFVRRHDRVLVSRLSNGQFDIQMGPESVIEGPGKTVQLVNPGRRYVIDHKSLEVVEGFLDR